MLIATVCATVTPQVATGKTLILHHHLVSAFRQHTNTTILAERFVCDFSNFVI